MKRTRPKIEIGDHSKVFALFAALNALGYDDENNPKGMSPERKKIRTALERQDWHSEYPAISRAAKQYHPWYLIRALFAKPSNFSRGFVSEFRKFSNELPIRKLWKISKDNQKKETRKLTPLFRREVTNIIRFLRNPQGVKKIVLISNPLDAYWRGYGFKVKSVGYVVVGPGATKNKGELMRHELLHIFAPPFRFPRRLVARHALPVAEGYVGRNIINRECVIRALDILYRKQVLNMNVSSALKREERYFPKIKECISYLERRTKRSYIYNS